ncbi:MAG: amidohydrolase [Burkholderiales bacterium]|nr:amidohydrolase [Burkholderiales bacterium]
MTAAAKLPYPALTIFTARRIHTMDESLPVATAVAVSEGRIVAVGSLEDMAPWREGRAVTVDDRFARHVLLPGLIDNHIHPFLGALLMPTEHIAPEAWRQADGSMRPAARTPEDYRRLLHERVAAHADRSKLVVSFGYQQSLHGKVGRPELDAWFPDRPVLLMQRSFHEHILNTRALTLLGITREVVGEHPQVNWEQGHFIETGIKIVLQRLMPLVMNPQWYGRGLEMMTQLMHQGGITTAADMLFGAVDPDYELAQLDAVFEKGGAPMRVVNVFDVRSFASRATGVPVGPPEQPIDFAAALAPMQALMARATPKVWFSKAVKLFADGAMFSQLMQMKAPGYIDGHRGEWLMAPEVLAEGVRTFWNAGWQMHTHVNGDGGMESVLEALSAAQEARPRFDHRFQMHHVGFHAAAQTERIAALGAHATVNPYYLHALGEDYARLGLGPERASQITRCGSLVRAGIKVSFHSDYMMAPPEPLLLAWCAATRKTLGGQIMAPEERLTLMQALRGVTIDAAWALRLDHEVGSIAAGKRADFCVLEDDPFERGADALKDLRIAGTVFEGEPRMLAQPVGSSIAGLAQVHADAAAAAPSRTSLYKAVAAACCGVVDRCDVTRQWAAWFDQARQAAAAA